MSELVAIVMAGTLAVAITYSLWLRRESLTLVDAFLLSIAVFLGAYTIADVLFGEQRHRDPLIVFEVFLGIGIGVLALLLFVRTGPRWVLAETSLRRLRDDLIACSDAATIGVITGAIAYRLYTALVIGDLGARTLEDLVETGETMPYWYTSTWQIAAGLAFAAGLAATAKAIATTGIRRVMWVMMVIAVIFFFFGLGRRSIFSFLLVVVWLIVTHPSIQTRMWVNAAILVLSVPVLIGLSNLYQAYRLIAFRGVPVISMLDALESDSVVELASNASATVQNLEERSSMWAFNYEVAEALAQGHGSMQWGSLLTGGFQNYIPAAFWEGKQVFEPETELLRALGLSEYDRPTNLFVYAQADFGYLGVLIAPTMMILVVLASAFVLTHLRSPFLRTVLMSFGLYYAINLEAEYNAMLQIGRDFVVVALVYMFIAPAYRLIRGAALVAPRY